MERKLRCDERFLTRSRGGVDATNANMDHKTTIEKQKRNNVYAFRMFG